MVLYTVGIQTKGKARIAAGANKILARGRNPAATGHAVVPLDRQLLPGSESRFNGRVSLQDEVQAR